MSFEFSEGGISVEVVPDNTSIVPENRLHNHLIMGKTIIFSKKMA